MNRNAAAGKDGRSGGGADYRDRRRPTQPLISFSEFRLFSVCTFQQFGTWLSVLPSLIKNHTLLIMAHVIDVKVYAFKDEPSSN